MARYIDADALMRELGINDMRCDKCGWGQYGYCKRGADFTDACFAIENAPTVDIVRCKDCVHGPKGTGANHDLEFPDYVCPCQCDDFWYSWMPKDDWFCADGERGEDAEIHK